MGSPEWISNRLAGWDDVAEWSNLEIPVGAKYMDPRDLVESIIEGKTIRNRGNVPIEIDDEGDE